MTTNKKQPAGKSNTEAWVPVEAGREVTTSAAIIGRALARIKSKRILLSLLHKEYQSGTTLLLDYGRQHLEIGKPGDWPHTETGINVLFKDNKLWNFFPVEVTAATENCLRTSLPKSLYRLQRRAHFRISVPSGSEADFEHHGISYSAIPIHDISAGGMQLCSRKKLPLSPGDELRDLVVVLAAGDASPKHAKPSQDLMVQIQSSLVARTMKEDKAFCYGIDFRHRQQEEQLLLRYVRQRELEMLRKGLGS